MEDGGHDITESLLPRPGHAQTGNGALSLYKRSEFNSVGIEKNALENERQAKPKVVDTGNVVWIILFLQGMGSLFGWNMFITAESFFRQTLAGSHWASCVGLYITLVFQVTNIITQFICAVYRVKRIFAALLLQCVIFAFCLVLVQIEDRLSDDLVFALIMGAVALDGAATAVMNAGVYGMSAPLPSEFTGAVMQGQAIAGVVPAAAAIVAYLVSPGDQKQSATIYFAVAVGVVVTCIVSFTLYKHNNFVIHYDNVARLSRQKSISMGIDNGKKFWPLDVWREIRSDAYAVFLVFAISLAIFPSMASNVVSYTWPGDDGQPNVLWMNFSCFLLFNVGDYTGRALASMESVFKHMTTRRNWILAVLRMGLLAAFFFCNLYQTRLPVVFTNDAFPVAFMVLLSVSNGFCGTVCMRLGPKKVDPGDGEVAGMLMAFLLALGIACGIWTSFLVSYAYNGLSPFCA